MLFQNALAGVLGISACVLLVQSVVRFNQSHEQGRFVASLVSEYSSHLRTLPDIKKQIASEPGWPDDSLAVQSWLVGSIMRGQSPDQVVQQLDHLIVGRSLSPEMNLALQRWSQALGAWAEFELAIKSGAKTPAPDVLLAEGRRRHHQASGYRRIGRGYDATAYYLFSVDVLTRFIEETPLDPNVPEALFLLGDSFLRLRHALPEDFRSDRLLNLVSELYPTSIWARRADELWRDEMRKRSA